MSFEIWVFCDFNMADNRRVIDVTQIPEGRYKLNDNPVYVKDWSTIEAVVDGQMIHVSDALNAESAFVPVSYSKKEFMQSLENGAIASYKADNSLCKTVLAITIDKKSKEDKKAQLDLFGEIVQDMVDKVQKNADFFLSFYTNGVLLRGKSASGRGQYDCPMLLAGLKHKHTNHPDCCALKQFGGKAELDKAIDSIEKLIEENDDSGHRIFRF